MDFIVDDSDDLIGAPVHLDMPIEFTSHSHKPLKEHFRDAIEWLVQFKVNPGFDKTDDLYRMAWRKLDDEVRGLATSKFSSAAWKKDFFMALRARPYYDAAELPKGDLLEARSCGACGRSGHPARSVTNITPFRGLTLTLREQENDALPRQPLLQRHDQTRPLPPPSRI
jgi:hypothetical protein